MINSLSCLAFDQELWHLKKICIYWNPLFMVYIALKMLIINYRYTDNTATVLLTRCLILSTLNDRWQFCRLLQTLLLDHNFYRHCNTFLDIFICKFDFVSVDVWCEKCRSWSDVFFNSRLIWIFAVCICPL